MANFFLFSFRQPPADATLTPDEALGPAMGVQMESLEFRGEQVLQPERSQIGKGGIT